MSESIEVVDYDPKWIVKFEEEKASLKQSLGVLVLQIEHIGSTAVEGLVAKPIIDILIGVDNLDDASRCIPLIEKLGYQYIPEHEQVLPNRRFFRKPHRGATNRDFHIHLVVINSSFWRRQLYFRDFLRTHENAREEYANLKIQLANKYVNDRKNYTDAKTDFILSILATSIDDFSD